jgi:hypothetical protein
MVLSESAEIIKALWNDSSKDKEGRAFIILSPDSPAELDIRYFRTSSSAIHFLPFNSKHISAFAGDVAKFVGILLLRLSVQSRSLLSRRVDR